MDVFDTIWNVSQDRRISELRTQLDQERARTDLARGEHTVKDLAVENLELKLRLGLLVRLLIAKGVISAEEYAKLIAETRPHG
jgi:hypothetical protein